MIHNNAGVLEDQAIDTISESAKRFTKCDRDKENLVRRLKCVSGFLSDETIEHSVETNVAKNISTTIRDVEMSADILRPRKHDAQGNTTRKQSTPMNTTL